MANDLATSKKYFLGDIQADLVTRDTGLTVGANALELIASSRINPVIETSPIDSASPELPNEPDTIDAVYAGGSLACHIRQPGTLSDPPVAGELPREFDVLARMTGHKRVIPASGKWVTWYDVGSEAEAATIEQRDILDNGETNLVTAWAAKASSAVEMSARKPVVFTAGGLIGRIGNITTAYEDGGTYGGTVSYAGGDPIVLRGAPCQIVDLSDDSVYGGGTLASPDYTVCLQGMTLDSARNVAPLDCVAADGGIRGARGEVTPRTGTLILEVVDVPTFNPRALQIAKQALEIRVKIPTGVDGVYLWGVGYFYITGVSDETIAQGRLLHTLTVRFTSPEDAADGSPAAGADPGQKFTAGTNAGLPNSDGVNAPAGARWAWQLVDEN